MLNREGTKDEAIHEAEDGGVRTDAERKRENGNKGEARRLEQHAQAKADVRKNLLDPNNAPNLARLFLDPRHVAKLAHRRIMRFFWRHPALDVVLRFPRDVLANILVQFLQHALAPPHHSPSCSLGRRIRAIAPASLSHLRVSSVSCRRPFGVSL